RILSVALVLFLLGFFGLVILQATNLVSYFKENINLMVEVKDGALVGSLDSLEQVIAQAAYTKPGSLQFISKEEALDMLRADFGEEFLKLDLPNPLYDVIVFNVRASYMNPDNLKAIREEIRSSPIVSDVYYQESFVGALVQNIQRIGWLALGLGVFFTFVAFVLIHNTIRLALYSNRFLIKNMQLVGASWGFISRPFLLLSLRNGIYSALIAIALLLGLYYLAQQDIPELRDIQDWLGMGLLFAGLLLFGILITLSSTYYVVNKYLKMRVDDLY
ncbi:MAG: permease-like cell division protein FtsX, partial [Phaeodactylibacter sp.]|nr:permease-like cell division protein FtsX [Phaeodactylibacter sp.]